MENSEISGSQFEPIKTFQADASLGKVAKLVHQQIVNQALLGNLGACVSTAVKSTTKECLCYLELNECEYFKKKKVACLCTPNSANFLYQTNQ